MNTPGQIIEFIEWVEPKVAIDVRNELAASTGHWEQYLDYLGIILERSRVANAAYRREVVDRIGSMVGADRQSLRSDAQAFLQDRHKRTTETHLEIESFYIFAKILLDRAADTFAFYFGISLRKRGSTHSQLYTKLQGFCAGRDINGRELQARLGDLADRIVSFRTDAIEHLAPTTLARFTLVHRDEDPKVHIADRATEDLPAVFERLDEHLVVLLAFMRVHARHSIVERRSSS